MVVSGCVVGVTIGLADKVDKFLAILGAVSCTPIAFGLPAVYHLWFCAETTCVKVGDWFIIVVSIFIIGYCTTDGIITWNEE
jgi:hypothetical protein